MRPLKRFLKQPKHFWANIRSISQEVGYTDKHQRIKVPTSQEIASALGGIGLTSAHLIDDQARLTSLGDSVRSYFAYRAQVLNAHVRPCLMDAASAKQAFQELRRNLRPRCPLPMNKQKGEKKAPAYLTGIINMLIERNAPGFACEYDPRKLTTIIQDGAPLRTLARRVDGAFPSTVNPLAVWEVKEYYYTTTFGSRVADGVYESLLDGMELEELREHEGIDVKHYLMVDGRYTWWECGRSYLCRLVDMLHMGYVDEVLFGREVLERLPEIVRTWVRAARST
jgi:hypothetical protein